MISRECIKEEFLHSGKGYRPWEHFFSHPVFPLSHQQEIFKSILLVLQSVFFKYPLVKIAKNSEKTEMCIKGEAHDLIEKIPLI